MYSRRGGGVNAAAAALLGAACCVQVQWVATGAARQLARNPLPPCQPAAELHRLFTPPHPQLGRYELCTTEAPLSLAVPAGWAIEAASPLDAFGSAGRYDRSAVARLYGGQPARVARGWFREGDHVESLTFISPFPDPALSRLVPGTLIIRFIICCT